MKESPRLDDIDRKILRALQRDAAQSHAALAEQVGASPASCWRRIRALETAGVLQRTVRLVDPRSVDRRVHVMCEVRMTSQSTEARQAFEAFLQTRGEVMEGYTMSGEWDYLLRVIVEDVEAYERFLMRDLLSHPSVATSVSHFALSQVKYTTAIPV